MELYTRFGGRITCIHRITMQPGHGPEAPEHPHAACDVIYPDHPERKPRESDVCIAEMRSNGGAAEIEQFIGEHLQDPHLPGDYRLA